MLDRIVRGLWKSIQREVLKENLSTFGDACILAEQIRCLDNFLRESGVGNKGYAPMDLDAVNTQQK